MKVYLAIVEDRHADMEIKGYLTLKEAVDAAENSLRELTRWPEDVERNVLMTDEAIADGTWRWLVHYSCESDYVEVVGLEI